MSDVQDTSGDQDSTGKRSGAEAGRGVAWLVCGRRTKWVVVVLWLGILLGLGGFAQKLTDAQDNQTVNWLPKSAESTQVLRESEDFRPEQMPTVIVYARESGLTDGDRARIDEDLAQIRALKGHGLRAAETPDPQFEKGDAPRAAQIFVPLTVGTDAWQRIVPAVDDIRGAVGRSADGLSVHITGPGGSSADFAEGFEGIDSTLLIAAMSVVVVMLLLTYRSPTLLFVPVISVVAALLTAQALVYLLAEHAGLTVNGQSAGILTVLVFGAGTDYALLLVARYREELRRHADRHEAMALALHRAGPAVLASGATVIIAMLVLMFAELNSTAGLGPVLAIGVAVALLALLTLFPALLVIMGRWIFWPVRPAFGSAEPTESGVWARTGLRIARRPRRVWAVGMLVLAGLSVGLMQLKASGLSYEDSFTGRPDSIVGSEVQARYFPAGGGDPLVILANADQADRVGETVAAVDGVADIPIATPRGVAAERSGRVYLEAVLDDNPSSGAAKDTVRMVRDALGARAPDAEAIVGGTTAAVVDMDAAVERDDKLIIPLVLLAVFVVLVLLLRALLAPVLLMATVVLSFAAALGISALFFRHVFDFAGEDTSFPLLVFVFLVALGIDYNIFLATRIKEEAQRRGTRQGAVTALAATGGVITSAGLVLAGTFAVFGTLPMVSFAEIGFAVAVGVLIDTFIVRSMLVTALFLDIGRRVWWPNALMRHRDEPVTTPAEVPSRQAEGAETH
ncbi:Heme uptake protein MmpL11 [Streptomyces sp. RB5]|uniref:Heme uptake protein MmpL11 n=1 Tax=Streptomyces smaragdinus TaxID=2585196 RepID=A0A7K0CGK3_9ACTN|nr:MMPL family transporter [Streptomyces smaragdinus]MQY11874.1 Heme uptake protein MmpL11 [Streptomyces smaragdinus]